MKTEAHLSPRPANFRPLTPLDFLSRSVDVHADRPAVIWRDRTWTYAELGGIVLALRDQLAARGIGPGCVVSVMASNRPEMLAAHFAVPMLGATLNAINTRLDADTVAYILGHSESRLMIADPTTCEIAEAAAGEAGVAFDRFSRTGTEAGDGLALLDARPVRGVDFTEAITDEWSPIAINYTSGTTGRPKGVVLSHRGAYLNAVGNVMALGMTERSAYLWTLPMFHCNGWCHTWAMTAAGGTHVCLDRVDPELIFDAIGRYEVTHMSCAPVVLYMLVNHPARAGHDPAQRVTVATGGAAPTSALIARMDALGFGLIHMYGLTESYGPATLRTLDETQEGLDSDARAGLLAQQGIRHVTANRLSVVDEAGKAVPPDGETVGEITLRGNTLMSGYYKDAAATEEAFRGGAFRTGDLAVVLPDGRISIRDRAKDVIISGGENISSLELESVLHRHPSVLMAAVVAGPHEKWGETPVAFIELKADAMGDAEALRAFCREHLAHFKVPGDYVFGELPKTATGKIQKFLLRDRARAARSGARAG